MTAVVDLSVEDHMSTVTVSEMTSKLPPHEFGPIFEEHYDLIYRTAYGITRTVEDAEDVIQMIFVQLLQREVPADLIKNPRGYFYKAAVNLSLRTIRSRQRQVLTNDETQFESSTGPAHSSHNEIHDRLQQAIAQLNQRAAQILI